MARKSESVNKDKSLISLQNENMDFMNVLSLLPIMPYHSIADLGCGPGYFTVPLGKQVFYGKVYAMDLKQAMLDETQGRLDRVHLTNVELAITKKAKMPLEDESVDGVFAAFPFQWAGAPDRLLREIQRCLRKGGWLAIIEWSKTKEGKGPLSKNRIDKASLEGITQKVGFRFTSRHSLNNEQYMLVMRK